MKKINIIIALLVMTLSLVAQNKTMIDTLNTINEVEIWGGELNRKIEVGKLNVPLQYLPMSVSSVSAKNLEARGITNIEDAVKLLPNVRMNTSYGAFQVLYVRGFGYTPIVIDGIRDERSTINSYPFSDLTNIESMELLKGPASVLYGHSVLGGVLNIVRKSPTALPTANARITYGSWNNKQANMDFGGKLAGAVNYRANINYSDQDGWRDNGNKRFSGYLALSARIDMTSKIDVRTGFNRDWYGTEIGLPPNMANDIYNMDGTLHLGKGEMQPNLNRKVRYNNESDFFRNEGWNISAKYEKELSENMKLTNHLAFTSDDINYFGTEPLSYLTSGSPIYKHYYETKTKDANGAETTKRTYINLDSVYLSNPLRFSHIANVLTDRLEMSGNFHTGNIKHNYMGGYSFSQMFRNSYSGYTLAPANDPQNLNNKEGVNVWGSGLYSHVAVNNPHSMGYIESNFGKVTIGKDYTHGVYFQNLIELNEKIKILLAGRYDFYQYMRSNALTYDGKRQYHKSEQAPYTAINHTAFTYRVGVVYLPVPAVSVFASAASYFKPDRTFAAGNTIYLDKNGNEMNLETGNSVYNPEKGFQMEVGARYTLNNLLQASTSIFYVRKNDVVRSFGRHKVGEDENGTDILKSISGQLASEESKGFDVELSFTPTLYTSFSFGYGYNDVNTRNLQSNKYIETDTQGLTLVPKNTFFGYGNVSVPKGVFTGLSFVYSVSFMDKVHRNYDKTLFFDSYWLTDLGLSYPLKNGIRMSVNVNNVFDKKYINQSMGSQMIPSMPRNFLASVSYKLR